MTREPMYISRRSFVGLSAAALASFFGARSEPLVPAGLGASGPRTPAAVTFPVPAENWGTITHYQLIAAAGGAR